jgi:hypothetical protein
MWISFSEGWSSFFSNRNGVLPVLWILNFKQSYIVFIIAQIRFFQLLIRYTKNPLS